MAATVTLVELQPSVTVYGDPETRTVFGFLMGLGAVAAGGGLVDSLAAGERRAAARVALAPTVGPGHFGLALGGSL
jgi:hypothetical protein